MITKMPPAVVDRIAPTRRPKRSIRGYQQWRSLLFMHWPVPIAELRPLVPASLELDLYEGEAYIGVVPFAMQGVRPRWWPAGGAFRFLETNVRTYVCCGDRPGVYFLSLDAASCLAVWGARTFWGLPYFHADMSLRREGDVIQYQTRRRGTGAHHAVHYRLGKLLGPSSPGTLEFFFLERYLLFVERWGVVWEGQVHHPPYPAQELQILSVSDELIPAAGLGPCSSPPVFAHYAEGVDVDIYALRRL